MTDGGATTVAVASRYDIFLSYNRADHESVEAVRRHLANEGLRPFIDYASLAPGLPWPDALERALTDIRAVAVFMGPNGFGGWQRREMFFALDLQVRAQKQNVQLLVIPVLLPGADVTACFLFLNSWVDLRGSLQAGMQVLVDAISGAAVQRSIVDPASVAPYLGLRAFSEDDSALFFGRDSAIDMLLKRVLAHRAVAIIGSSGSGKSSVVFAGLVPALRRQRRPNPTWEICSFTPGRHPWRRLADGLAALVAPGAPLVTTMQHASAIAKDLEHGNGAFESVVERVLQASKGSTRLLLVIDQLEELFTLARVEQRHAVISTLLDATQVSPVTIVCTLRADYVAAALDYDPRFADIFGRANVHLGPLTRSELERVVESPIRTLGAKLEPGLRDALLDDVLRAPGQLPLLSYALDDLWQRCSTTKTDVRDVTLTHAAYSDTLESAIGRRAEALFDSLSSSEQEGARQLFRKLVRLADGGEAGGDTRRRARRAEIGEAGWAVALRFAAAEYRLVVVSAAAEVGEATAEVAHEAILENWGRLKAWVSDERSRLILEQRVADAIEAWRAHDREEDYLLDGPLLSAIVQMRPDDRVFDTALLEFIIRSLVNASGPLSEWVRRYAGSASVITLAREYLASADEARRRRALDLLRWTPEPDAVSVILASALHDSSVGVRRYAVEVLYARGDRTVLRDQLGRGPAPSDTRRLLEAIAHARNIRGVGLIATSSLSRTERVNVVWLSILDLVSLHRSAVAMVFALTSVGTIFAWNVVDTIVTMIARFVLQPLGVSINLYPFTGGAIDFVAAFGVVALLRVIIDQRGLTRAHFSRVGLLAGSVDELITFVGRLLEELLAPVLHSQHSPINFLFLFSDRLPTLLAMGVFGSAFPLIVASEQPRRQLVWIALAVAVVSALSKCLAAAPILLLDSSNRGFVMDNLLNAGFGSILGFAVALTGLYTVRFALRLAFMGQAFPAWPVPPEALDEPTFASNP